MCWYMYVSVWKLEKGRREEQREKKKKEFGQDEKRTNRKGEKVLFVGLVINCLAVGKAERQRTRPFGDGRLQLPPIIIPSLTNRSCT